jgi:hypothetical protein
MNLDDVVDQLVDERSLLAMERLTGSRTPSVLDAIVEAAGRLLASDDPHESDDEIVDTLHQHLVDTKATGSLIDGLGMDSTTQEFAMGCLAEIGDMVAFEPILRVLEESKGSLREAAASQLSLLTNYDFGDDVAKWSEWNGRRIQGLAEQVVEDRADQARRLNLRLKGTKRTEAEERY